MQIKIPYKDISQECLKDIYDIISYSTVTLIGHDENDQPIGGLFASGSFVIINSIYGVLTAKHVWEEFIKKKANKICFVYHAKKHYSKEELQYLNVYKPEINIDICLIELPPNKVEDIKASSIFHPIISDNFSNINDIKERIWITAGFPLEIQSEKDTTIDILRYPTHLVHHQKIYEDWDIIELDVESNNTQLPKSFGGMSGGGMWNINLFYNDDSGKRKFRFENNLKDFLLVGVNYYEETPNGRVNKIRGVGPISIYSGMTKLVHK